MKKSINRFARIKCVTKPDSTDPFFKTVLYLDKDLESVVKGKSIYGSRTVDIYNIPWEILEEIGPIIIENQGAVLNQTVTEFFERHNEIKSILDYVYFWRTIKKFEGLFAPKKTIWPYFLRDLPNSKYHNAMHETKSVTEKNVGSKSTDLMKRTVNSKEEKFMHTVRVLYRIQTEQLEILRKYNNRRNNIYYTDFEEGNRKSQRAGYFSSLEYLSYEEAKKRKKLWGAIEIAAETYNPNGHLYYLSQLRDQLMALCCLRNLDKANFWAISGIPSIRGTLVGQSEDEHFEDSHFVAVNQFEPGVSGRLSFSGKHAEDVYEELQKINKPRLVELEPRLKVLRGKLLDHIEFVEKNVIPRENRDEDLLKKNKRLAQCALTMGFDEFSNKKRGKLEDEIKIISKKISKN